jgi:hypothetical protein
MMEQIEFTQISRYMVEQVVVRFILLQVVLNEKRDVS